MGSPLGYVEQQFRTTYRGEGDSVYDRYARERADMLCRLVGPGESILDVGCRTGVTLPYFNDVASRVVGVDVVPEYVAKAQLLGEAMVADAHDLPFSDNEFDWVFSSHTLEHAYDPQLAAREISRVGAKGLFLALPLEGEEEKAIAAERDGHYFWTLDPLTWAVMFHSPKWFMHTSAITPRGDCIIVFFRSLKEPACAP